MRIAIAGALLGLALVSGCTRAGEAPEPDVELLFDRCASAPGTVTCGTLLSAHGVRPARSDGRGTMLGEDIVPVLVRSDGTVVLRAPSSGAAEHHQIPELAEVLGPAPARFAAEVDTRPRVALMADRDARFGDLIDVVFTAYKAGVGTTFVVIGSDGLAEVPISGPIGWNTDESVHYDLACASHVLVSGDELSARACGARSWTSLRSSQTRRIHEVVRQDYNPGRLQLLSLEVSEETPWSSVVHIADAVRGAGCPLVTTQKNPGCTTIRGITVDLDPPIPWRAGDWDALQVRLAKVELTDYAKHPRSAAKLRARALAAIPTLQACLRDAPSMRHRMPSSVNYVLSKTTRGKDVHIAFPNVGYGDKPECLDVALGPGVPEGEQIFGYLAGDAEVTFEIVVPPESG